MTAPTDPLPGVIADCLTGLKRLGDDGPFLKIVAHPSDDGREIAVEVTQSDFLAEDRTVRIVLHLSPQMPLPIDPATSNGPVDPTTAAPGGAAS